MRLLSDSFRNSRWNQSGYYLSQLLGREYAHPLFVRSCPRGPGVSSLPVQVREGLWIVTYHRVQVQRLRICQVCVWHGTGTAEQSGESQRQSQDEDNLVEIAMPTSEAALFQEQH